MRKAEKSTLRISPFYYITQYRIPLIFLIFLTVFFFIWFILSLPKQKKPDPLDPESYPYTLKKTNTFVYFYVQPFDIEDDGTDEFFSFTERYKYGMDIKTNSIHIFNIDGHEREQFNIQGILTLNKAWDIDINKDGEKEIIFCETLHDSIFIHIRTLNDEKLYKFFAVTKDRFTKPYKPWGCQVFPFAYSDVNKDGRIDIIVHVLTTEAGSPRGIYAFDYLEGKCIWKYKMGAFIGEHPLFYDINNDGEMEIIFSTVSYGNNKQPINGTDDYHNYFIILNQNGDELYKYVFDNSRGRKVFLRSGDITGDGKTEFILMNSIQQPSIAQQKESEIFLFNPEKNELIKKLHINNYFKSFLINDLDYNGKDELIFIDKDNEIKIYQYNNFKNEFFLKESHIITNNNLIFNNIILNFIEDLDNDGIKEIIMSSPEFFIILDNNFNLKALKQSPDWKVSIIKCGFGKKRLLYPQNGNSCLFELRKNITYYTRHMNHMNLLLPIFFIFCTLLLVHILIKNNIENKCLYNNKGVIKVNRKNQITFINKKAQNQLEILEKFLFPGKHFKFLYQKNILTKLHFLLKKLDIENLPSHKGKITLNKKDSNKKDFFIETKKILNNKGKENEKIILISEKDSALQSDHILTWGNMAQQLAHEIKNPLSAVLLNLKRIHQIIVKDLGKKSDKYNRYVGAITEEVERLRNATNSFMKFSDSSRMTLQRCNVEEIIKKVLRKLEIEEEKNIKINYKPSKEKLHIRAEHEMLKLALTNIILNAKEAIKDTGEINITTRAIEHIDKDKNSIKDYVQIEVMDTGKGIEKKTVEKIFDPGYTNKPGGAGFGLAIARHIIISHKGYIEISSEPGSGTVVTIDIPFE